MDWLKGNLVCPVEGHTYAVAEEAEMESEEKKERSNCGREFQVQLTWDFSHLVSEDNSKWA